MSGCTHKVSGRVANAANTSLPRAGAALVEVMAASVVLVTLMAVAVQFVGMLSDQRNVAWQRQIAQEEAANVLERVAFGSDESPIDRRAATAVLSDGAASALRDAVLEVHVLAAGVEPTGRPVEVTIRWRNRHGDFVSPVRLVAWTYRNTVEPDPFEDGASGAAATRQIVVPSGASEVEVLQ